MRTRPVLPLASMRSTLAPGSSTPQRSESKEASVRRTSRRVARSFRMLNLAGCLGSSYGVGLISGEKVFFGGRVRRLFAQSTSPSGGGVVDDPPARALEDETGARMVA